MHGRTKQKNLFEVSLTIRSNDLVKAELLKGIFVRQGIGLSNLSEYVEGSKIRVSVFLNDAKKAQKIKDRLSLLSLKNTRVGLCAIRKCDWQDKWKEEIKPFPLAQKFQVVPLWRKDGYVPSRQKEPVYLDTTLAFGTGLHETTRFMSEFIVQCAGKFSSFLDVGAGTGILSIIARKCGAKDVEALDICPESVHVARQNFVLNDCKGIKAFKSDFKKSPCKRRYDFVAANLISQDLIDMNRKIYASLNTSGYLAISGISLENFQSVKDSFRKFPLRCLRIRKGKKWCAILYKRSAPHG